MGFGKKNKPISSMPAKVTEAKFEDLSRHIKMSMATYMSPSVHRQIEMHNNEKERTAALRQFVLDPSYTDRAQTYYDVVVLDKAPGGQAAAQPQNDIEKRFLLMCHDFLKGKDEEFVERMSTLIKQFNSDILPTMVKKALAEAAEKHRPIVIHEKGKVRKVKGVLPPEFERMVKLASARIPIMLVGPAGCGKTYLCEKLAEALKLEYGDQSCSEGMSESVFNGMLLPTGAAGMFVHHDSPFIKRYEEGGVFLLDEMDAGDPNLFTYINKAVANSSYTSVQRYKKPVIVKHDDFVLVAAANTFGHGADAMYVGRNQLDAATLDRFKVGLITMDYSQEVEASIANDELCAWAWGIRKQIREHKLRRIMSTRVIKDLATMTTMYKWKQTDWEDAYFTGWSEAELKLLKNSA